MLSIFLSNKKASHTLPLLALTVAAMALVFSACAPYQARKSGSVHYHARGEASWYGPGFAGRKTANGERYNPNGLTAAHKTLPLGTMVEVTNLDNEKSVVVRINDRGPYVHGRIIDLSKGAAQKIGMMGSGTAPVEVVALGSRKIRTEQDTIPVVDELNTASRKGEEQSLPENEQEFSSQRKTVASKRTTNTDNRPVRKNGVEYLIEQEKANKNTDDMDTRASQHASTETAAATAEDVIDEPALAKTERPRSKASDEDKAVVTPATTKTGKVQKKNVPATGAERDAEDVISGAEKALRERREMREQEKQNKLEQAGREPEAAPAKASTKKQKREHVKNATKTGSKAAAKKEPKGKAPTKAATKATTKTGKPEKSAPKARADKASKTPSKAKPQAAKNSSPGKKSGSSYNTDEF